MGYRWGDGGVSDDDHVTRQVTWPTTFTVSSWFKLVAGAHTGTNVRLWAVRTTDDVTSRGGLLCYQNNMPSTTDAFFMYFDAYSGNNAGAWEIPLNGAVQYANAGAYDGPLSTRWHNLTISMDTTSSGNVPLFYFNGIQWPTRNVSVRTTPNASRSTDITVDLRTGNGQLTGTACPNMFLGPMAAWSGILTAREIAGIGRGMDPLRIRPASLLMYCPMDGSILGDLTARGATSGGTPTLVTSHPPIRYGAPLIF